MTSRPITGELRDAMQRFDNYANVEKVALDGADFDRLCDAIDSIHANLERENASLKAELDRLMGEQDRDGWVELPKDADGEYIHIGDAIVWVDDLGAQGTADKICFEDDGWWVFIGGVGRHPEKCRHHQPDTWERIIEDARTCTGSAGNYTSVPSMRWTSEVDSLVARCRALAGDAS